MCTETDSVCMTVAETRQARRGTGPGGPSTGLVARGRRRHRLGRALPLPALQVGQAAPECCPEQAEHRLHRGSESAAAAQVRLQVSACAPWGAGRVASSADSDDSGTLGPACSGQLYQVAVPPANPVRGEIGPTPLAAGSPCRGSAWRTACKSVQVQGI